MTSFVYTDHPQHHAGVARAEAVIAAAGRLGREFDGARGVAALMLGAIVSALLVAADRLVDSWAGGGLLLAWVVLWAVAVAALALFAAPVRRWAGALVARMDGWSARVARERADARMWAIAKTDPRLMADLQAAVLRNDQPARPVAGVARRVSLRALVLESVREARQARAEAGSLPVGEAQAAVSRSAVERADARAARVPAITRVLQRAEHAVAGRAL